MFPKPIKLKALPDYHLRIEFSDGIKGEVDLSYLVGKGVFKILNDKNIFNNVTIHPETNAISWNNDAELCPDSLYLKIIGKSFEQWQKENMEYAPDK